MDFKIGQTIELFNGSELVQSGKITKIDTELPGPGGEPGKHWISIDDVLDEKGLRVFCIETVNSYTTG